MAAKHNALSIGRAWCLAPLLLLLAVFGIAAIVRPAAGFLPVTFDAQFTLWTSECSNQTDTDNSILLGHPGGSLEAFGRDVSGRIRWAAAAAAALALGFVTLLASAMVVARHLSGQGKHALTGFLIAIVVLGTISLVPEQLGHDVTGRALGVVGFLLLLTIAYGYASDRRALICGASVAFAAATTVWVVTELPLGAWLTDALAHSTPADSGDAERKYRTLALTAPVFDRALLVLHSPGNGWLWFDRAIGGMALLVVVALAMAAGAMIADCERKAGPDEEQGLRDRAESLRLLQYLGAAVLVSGVIFVKMLHDWPLAMICEESYVSLLTDMSNHWSALVGTYWTLLLVAVLVPAHIAIAGSARELAGAKLKENKAPALSEKAVGDWLDERGLRASPVKQLTQLVALISPWLASVPVAALIDFMKKALGD